jgi:outer membrane PBP1 activator LpoA protein
MTPQNALDRIKFDTPIKALANSWQYERELEVLQQLIEDYKNLIKGIQALSTLDQMNVKVLLQSKNGSN